MGFLRKNLLTVLVTPLLILLIGGSFYRFVVLRDYYVTYEIDCDPAVESCYVYCEDDECAEPYYYAYMEKYAATVYEQCGPDITECDAAYECLPEDGDDCTVTYCDAEEEECSVPEEVIEEEAEEIGEEEENIDTEEIFFDEMEYASSSELVPGELLKIEGGLEIE